MNLTEAFGSAKWVGASDASIDKFYILRSHFNLKKVKKATLRVLGLGIFHCYINGVRVGDDLFLPLNSEFEPRENFPANEVLSDYRIYVPEYDITSMLKCGDNTIAIHFGGGWYTYQTHFDKPYGTPKAIYRIFGEGESEEFEISSSLGDKISESFVKSYILTSAEKLDYTDKNVDAVSCDFDDSAWECAALAIAPETKYCFSDCPKDKVCEIIEPVKLSDKEEYSVYDCGKNTTGYPVLKLKGAKGDVVRVVFSEEKQDDDINETFVHKQTLEYICDGSERTVRPLFSWFGFRYFRLYGNAELKNVEVVHTDAKVNSSFESDNKLLNWLYETFINTQLTNMHTGIPSDCPHLERRGYTGDGQLACHAVMNVLDADKFYRKWMQDIADSQDKISGHVQYTAPCTYCGGGPGGWGCAIVEVPYQHFKHYGDKSVLEKYYPNMLRYFDFLEEHSDKELVISDMEGRWCLGDWCTPISVILPAPFVNNYFYIKSLIRCIEIAKLIGKTDDIEKFEKKIAERKEATVNAYFNKWDGNFLGCQQGANAFALDIGLGDERTYPNLVAYYEKLGGYDTGIFGTEIVTRILFERGNGELAAKLITSDTYHSFAQMKKFDATTIWEYWPGSRRDRSHNHPMFGAVVAYLYDYLLGIRQEQNEYGYGKIIIAPSFVSGISKAKGHRAIPAGEVSVSYEKGENSVDFNVTIPEGATAEFVYNGKRTSLNSGVNSFKVEL